MNVHSERTGQTISCTEDSSEAATLAERDGLLDDRRRLIRRACILTRSPSPA